MDIPAIQKPVLGLYDRLMWESISSKAMRLQKCRECGQFRYPPGPTCSFCLSLKFDWELISGQAIIWSWVIFHRQYLEAYPTPYNVISIQLKEGPLMFSNLVGPTPTGSWIGELVNICYDDIGGDFILPRFRLR